LTLPLRGIRTEFRRPGRLLFGPLLVEVDHAADDLDAEVVAGRPGDRVGLVADRPRRLLEPGGPVVGVGPGETAAAAEPGLDGGGAETPASGASAAAHAGR